eukprot:5822039-Amphidinium_carterae.1
MLTIQALASSDWPAAHGELLPAAPLLHVGSLNLSTIALLRPAAEVRPLQVDLASFYGERTVSALANCLSLCAASSTRGHCPKSVSMISDLKGQWTLIKQSCVLLVEAVRLASNTCTRARSSNTVDSESACASTGRSTLLSKGSTS